MTLAVGGAIGLWVGILVLGTTFIWGGFEEARLQHRKTQIRIEELQEKQDKVSLALEAYEERKGDIMRLEDALLSADDILPLLLSFEEHANVTGNEYTVQVTEEDLGIVLHIQLAGTFRGLYEFLDRFQTLPKIMQIQRMNTRSFDTESEITTSLRIKVFSLITKK